jgi:hypothetical protein
LLFKFEMRSRLVAFNFDNLRECSSARLFFLWISSLRLSFSDFKCTTDIFRLFIASFFSLLYINSFSFFLSLCLFFLFFARLFLPASCVFYVWKISVIIFLICTVLFLHNIFAPTHRV